MLKLKNVLINIIFQVHSSFLSSKSGFCCPFLCNKCCSTCRFGNLNSSKSSFLKKDPIISCSKFNIILYSLFYKNFYIWILNFKQRSACTYLLNDICLYTFCAFLLSALWFWWYIREKFETITGTGSAMTKTPDSEQTPPIILPNIVFGTMSPYLKEGNFFNFTRENLCSDWPSL